MHSQQDYCVDGAVSPALKGGVLAPVRLDKSQDGRLAFTSQLRQTATYVRRAGFTDRETLIRAYLSSVALYIPGVGELRRQLLVDLIFTLSNEQWTLNGGVLPGIDDVYMPNAHDTLDLVLHRSYMRAGRTVQSA